MPHSPPIVSVTIFCTMLSGLSSPEEWTSEASKHWTYPFFIPLAQAFIKVTNRGSRLEYTISVSEKCTTYGTDLTLYTMSITVTWHYWSQWGNGWDSRNMHGSIAVKTWHRELSGIWILLHVNYTTSLSAHNIAACSVLWLGSCFTWPHEH
jgi:hypothetical protein